MAAVPTLLVLYSDDREVRINEADFDPALHRRLPTAADDGESGDGEDDTNEPPPSPRARRRK